MRPRNLARCSDILKWKITKILLIIASSVLIFMNLFLSYMRTDGTNQAEVQCNQNLVLGELASYYEKLLQRKGVNSDVIKNAIRNNAEKTFNVFDDDKIAAFKRENLNLRNHNGQLKEKENNIFIQSENKIRNFRLSSKKDVFKGLIVDWWSDVCLQRVSWKSVWHPLFPTIPQHTTVTLKTEDDEKILNGVYRRLHGYIFVRDSDATYNFRLMSRDGAEVIIQDTGFNIHNIHRVNKSVKYREKSVAMHLRLSKSLMDYQDQRIQIDEMFSVDKRNITLKRDRLYHIEILQGGKYFSKFSLRWQKASVDGAEFMAIDQKHLCHVSSNPAAATSILRQKYQPFLKYPFLQNEMLKVSFYKRHLLTSEKEIAESSYQCRPVKKDHKTIQYIYQGYYEYTENVLVYPKENFNHFQTNLGQTSLKEKEAVDVANKVFDKITKMHKGNLELLDVVHVQTNYNKTYGKFLDISKTYYFVELDIKKDNDDSLIYRSSHFVKPLPSGDICFLTEWKWKPGVKINLLTAIRNQLSWLKYLIKMLEELTEKTKETNVKLVVVDYNSADGNYEAILKSSKLKHQYLNPLRNENWPDKFSKVKALNYGIKHVKDKDSIIFILDLHLQLPLNIFDRIRKLTTPGRTAYNPSLLKLACGEHEQYTDLVNSEWLDYGTGMMAMYKSDWDIVGGFNEKKFNNRWGGEDWEVMDRIVSNGIYIIHQRMARFYHTFHRRDGMWN